MWLQNTLISRRDLRHNWMMFCPNYGVGIISVKDCGVCNKAIKHLKYIQVAVAMPIYFFHYLEIFLLKTNLRVSTKLLIIFAPLLLIFILLS